MIKVFGFPRSGNHLTMQLLADNFYPDDDLTSPGGQVGHWADRADVPPVENGQLAGHHGPPAWGYEQWRSAYVYRDGRAVAASLFRSNHFKHPRDADMPFSEWIRQPLDWRWTPGNRIFMNDGQNVIQHWRDHLALWEAADALTLRYEDLCTEPERKLKLMSKFFRLTAPDEWQIPDKLVGWFPSGGAQSGWRGMWNKADEEWFFQQLPSDFYGVSE